MKTLLLVVLSLFAVNLRAVTVQWEQFNWWARLVVDGERIDSDIYLNDSFILGLGGILSFEGVLPVDYETQLGIGLHEGINTVTWTDGGINHSIAFTMQPLVGTREAFIAAYPTIPRLPEQGSTFAMAALGFVALMLCRGLRHIRA